MIYYVLQSNLTSIQKLVLILAYFIAIIFSLVAHEVAHGVVAYKCGDDTPKIMGRLSLNPFRHFDLMGSLSFLIVGFGWAKPVQVNPLKFRNYRKGMALVSISGVLTNIILAFFFVPLYLLSFNLLIYSNAFYFFLFELTFFLCIINISLALFNLLPIYPLDGFNFINTFLKYDNKFSKFMIKYGSLILIGFVLIISFTDVFGIVINAVMNLFIKFWSLIL